MFRAAGVLAILALAGLAQAKEPTTAELDAAVKRAKPLVAKARKAERKAKEAKEALREAEAAMRPYAKAVREGCWTLKKVPKRLRPFAETWNEMVTVGRYHGVKTKGGYILERIRFAYHGLLGGVPVSSRWRWKWPSTDQLSVHFRLLRPGSDSVLRYIKVWRYRWDTLYSGVGGENAKELAEEILELEKIDARREGRKVSKKVTVRKLNRHFRRCYYYYAETFDVDLEEHVVSRNFYFKGKTATFCVEVIDRKKAAGDDAVTLWRLEDEGVEVRAFLDTIHRNPAVDR
jgi:hypothetical protein